MAGLTIQSRFRSIYARVIHPKPVVKLVGIASNEAAYIPSWVFHHFRIGVDLIEIYINNTEDNSLKICRKIKKSNPFFKFIKADHLLNSAIKEGKSFQLAAYNRSLERSRRGKDNATHILTLDLDEYLIPSNLKNNLKQLLRQCSSFDAISFLWYSDDFNHKNPPFQFHIKATSKVYRLDHVKTLARISENVQSCNHHNFYFKRGKEPLIGLGGLQNIKLSDQINTTSNCSKVNKSFLHTLDSYSTEPWFVLHRIYRSEEEYLASLCRGRKHNNDNRPLKVNRWGLAPYPWHKSDPITLSFKQKDFDNYLQGFRRFVTQSGVERQLKVAQQLITQKNKVLEDMLVENNKLITEYRQIFIGTRYST